MVIDNFYLVLLAMVVTLGMLKHSVGRSNTFLTIISLLCCFCVIEAIFPVEEQQVQWAGFMGCSPLLLFTSQVCVPVLRKLNYTQDTVKRITDKGFPKWLFSRITVSNPETVSEKVLFDLMVRLLTINLMILYFLIKMVGLFS